MRNILRVAFLSILSYFAHFDLCGQIFNNHPDDCPSLAVATKCIARSVRCWPTQINNIIHGDTIAFSIYFHNNSPIPTDIKVRHSDPRNGLGKSLVVNGLSEPLTGSGAGGFAEVNFTDLSGLKYVHTKVFWNDKLNPNNGKVVDTTGRIFGEGEPFYVPGLCDDCSDSFRYQGAAVVVFKVIKYAVIEENSTPVKDNRPVKIRDIPKKSSSFDSGKISNMQHAPVGPGSIKIPAPAVYKN